MGHLSMYAEGVLTENRTQVIEALRAAYAGGFYGPLDLIDSTVEKLYSDLVDKCRMPGQVSGGVVGMPPPPGPEQLPWDEASSSVSGSWQAGHGASARPASILSGFPPSNTISPGIYINQGSANTVYSGPQGFTAANPYDPLIHGVQGAQGSQGVPGIQRDSLGIIGTLPGEAASRVLPSQVIGGFINPTGPAILGSVSQGVHPTNNRPPQMRRLRREDLPELTLTNSVSVSAPSVIPEFADAPMVNVGGAEVDNILLAGPRRSAQMTLRLVDDSSSTQDEGFDDDFDQELSEAYNEIEDEWVENDWPQAIPPMGIVNNGVIS
jgi:hypothetical protein